MRISLLNNDCERCDSVYSPAAYLLALCRYIEHYFSTLNSRKDMDYLFGRMQRKYLINLPITCDEIRKKIAQPEIVKEVLTNYIIDKSNFQSHEEVYNALKNSLNPPPYFYHSTKFNEYLKVLGTSLKELHTIFSDPESRISEEYFAEKIGISYAELSLIIPESYGITQEPSWKQISEVLLQKITINDVEKAAEDKNREFFKNLFSIRNRNDELDEILDIIPGNYNDPFDFLLNLAFIGVSGEISSIDGPAFKKMFQFYMVMKLFEFEILDLLIIMDQMNYTEFTIMKLEELLSIHSMLLNLGMSSASLLKLFIPDSQLDKIIKILQLNRECIENWLEVKKLDKINKFSEFHEIYTLIHNIQHLDISVESLINLKISLVKKSTEPLAKILNATSKEIFDAINSKNDDNLMDILGISENDLKILYDFNIVDLKDDAIDNALDVERGGISSLDLLYRPVRVTELLGLDLDEFKFVLELLNLSDSDPNDISYEQIIQAFDIVRMTKIIGSNLSEIPDICTAILDLDWNDDPDRYIKLLLEKLGVESEWWNEYITGNEGERIEKLSEVLHYPKEQIEYLVEQFSSSEYYQILSTRARPNEIRVTDPIGVDYSVGSWKLNILTKEETRKEYTVQPPESPSQKKSTSGNCFFVKEEPVGLKKDDFLKVIDITHNLEWIKAVDLDNPDDPVDILELGKKTDIMRRWVKLAQHLNIDIETLYCDLFNYYKDAIDDNLPINNFYLICITWIGSSHLREIITSLSWQGVDDIKQLNTLERIKKVYQLLLLSRYLDLDLNKLKSLTIWQHGVNSEKVEEIEEILSARYENEQFESELKKVSDNILEITRDALLYYALSPNFPCLQEEFPQTVKTLSNKLLIDLETSKNVYTNEILQAIESLQTYIIRAQTGQENIDDLKDEHFLKFINSLNTVEDIMGGAYDDPSLGYGDQVFDYDIGEIVAERILEEREKLGGKFTQMAQLLEIDGLGEDKVADMMYRFRLTYAIQLRGEWWKNMERDWEWMQRYVLWEASQKVFLYPENYLIPELRDNKSPFFEELEDQISQGEVTPELAESSISEYLQKLRPISSIHISGTRYDYIKKILYIFARSNIDEKTTFIRSFMNQRVWGPWIKIPIDIESNRVHPLIAYNRLYIFWIETESEEDDEEIRYKHKLCFSYSLDTKKWSEKVTFELKKSGESLFTDAEFPWFGTYFCKGIEIYLNKIPSLLNWSQPTHKLRLDCNDNLTYMNIVEDLFPVNGFNRRFENFWYFPDGDSFDLLPGLGETFFYKDRNSSQAEMGYIKYGEGIFIYKHTNYGEPKQRLEPGSYRANDLEIGNDELTSLRVPPGYKVTLFIDDKFQGQSRVYYYNTPSVGRDFNDKTSSIIVEEIGITYNNVVIYKDAGYSGTSQELEIGEYDTGELTIGDNALSSLRIPEGLQVTLFEEPNFGGRKLVFSSDTPYVSDDFNDKTSSIKVEECKHSTSNVIIYKNTNYGEPKQILDVLSYSGGDLDIGNDKLTSIKVPAGLKVTLFEHVGFRGESRVITCDTPSVGKHFNDKTSSIIVEEIGTTYNNVIIYEHTGYLGNSQELEVGIYDIDDLEIGNDKLSSIRIPPGIKVTLFEDKRFRGKELVLTSDTPYVGYFNDLTSSIIVEEYQPLILKEWIGKATYSNKFINFMCCEEGKLRLIFCRYVNSYKNLSYFDSIYLMNNIDETFKVDDAIVIGKNSYFFCSDQYRCFIITVHRDSFTFDSGITNSYSICQLDYGKYCTVKDILFQKGVESLYDPDLQTKDIISPLNLIYDIPNNLFHQKRLDSLRKIEFCGPNKIYNWELFFHIPTYIADALNQNRKFEMAAEWFHFIFNPYIKPDESGITDVSWKFRPFVKQLEEMEEFYEYIYDTEDIDIWRNDPFNPHAIARVRPFTYQKSTILFYIENLLEWADQDFTRDTQESINSARIRYLFIEQLLGIEEFEVEIPQEKVPRTLKTMNKASVEEVLNDLLKTEDSDEGAVDDEESYKTCLLEKWTDTIATPIDPYSLEAMLINVKVGCIPENPVFKTHLYHLETNLRKIRTGRNIAGVGRILPLFEAAIDPMSTVTAVASGLGLENINYSSLMNVGPYRFVYLIERAKSLANLVVQTGNALLLAIEKKESEEMAYLKAQQDLKLAKANVHLRKLRVIETKDSLKMVEKQTERSKYIQEHYEGLIDDGKNQYEINALNYIDQSITMMRVSQVLQGAAAVASLYPTTPNGGPNWSGFFSGLAGIASTEANILSTRSSIASMNASFERRKQEWKFQKKLAMKEEAISKQNEIVAQDHVKIAEMEQTIAEMQADFADETLEFLKQKFTNRDLYRWMVKRLSKILYGFYNLAYTAARMAQATMEFERNETYDFISYGYWDSEKKGLLSGDQLLLDINRMDDAYIKNNARKLEITKVISLAQMAPEAMIQLRTHGKATFTTCMEWFDRDFPGHYQRIIKSVRFSLLALVGPGTNVNTTLSTHDNSIVVVNPDTDPITIPRGQSVALSGASNSSGLFDLTYRDERYLPFEGSGVAVTWEIEIPKASNKFDFETIIDVILTIDYTALSDPDYKRQIIEQLTSRVELMMPISARTSFPDAWYHFHNPIFTIPGNHLEPYTLVFNITRAMFPPNEEDHRLESVKLKFNLGDLNARIPFNIKYTSEDGKVGEISKSTGIDGTLSIGNLLKRFSPFGQWEIKIDRDCAPESLWARDDEGNSLMVDQDTEIPILNTEKITNLIIGLSYEANLEWPPENELI
ncbi:MAG: beta/gamma crystallin-related protein [Promethearchaeota archaeon]